jgi:hypothetical protein
MENPMYKKAKEMSDKVKAGEGEYKDKKCNDCHNGKQKPEKK